MVGLAFLVALLPLHVDGMVLNAKPQRSISTTDATLDATLPVSVLDLRKEQAGNTFEWDLCSVTTISNLGGLGPDSGPPELRYERVGCPGKYCIDLVVQNITPYAPHNSSRNYARGCFGVVNLALMSDVELQFTFVMHATDIPVTINEFYLSTFDLDCSSQGTEEVTFSAGWDDFYLSPTTELTMSGQSGTGGPITFTSTEYGTGSDNPPPLELLQKHRAVSVKYSHRSSATINLKVTDAKGGRNVLIAGKTMLSDTGDEGGGATPAPTRGSRGSETPAPTRGSRGSETPAPIPGRTGSDTPAPTRGRRGPATPSPTDEKAYDATTTPAGKSCNSGTCIIWGDPHIITFDLHKKRRSQHPLHEAFFRTREWKMDQISVYDEGTYWLVSSDLVKIQARYWHNKTEPNFTNLGAVAVSGPFIDHNVLVIRSLTGATTWNGEEILPLLPSTFSNEYIHAQFTVQSKMVKNGNRGPGIEVDMPLGVHLTVNRWKQNLAVELSMCQQESGQSGQCGNFNDVPADDALFPPDRVPTEEHLF